MAMTMAEFCSALPKVELHAHLNGSLSQDTMARLLQLHRDKFPGEPLPADCDTLIQSGEKGTFDDPFRMFAVIQGVTDHPEAVSLATRATLAEFAADGVRYLELRSTPREVQGRMTRSQYCEAILSELARGREGITAKLLLSVDRRRQQDVASTVELYRSLKPRYQALLVGIDVSGDARVGDIRPLIPLLRELRGEGVQLAVHLAEVPNPGEVAELLEFRPDRIGHGTCIHPSLGGSQHLWKALEEARVPVEVCLTSNITCACVPGVREHQAGLLHSAGLPFILCTDDKGVFSCSLSGEYCLAAEAFTWDRRELFSISRAAIEHCFTSQVDKENMRQLWDTWLAEHKNML